MTDPQPPRKPSSPVKWIALGCGCLFLLLAGVGGIFGFLAFRLGKEFNAASTSGQHYLRTLPEVEATFGTLSKVEQTLVNVWVDNKQSVGFLEFALSGDKGSGRAEVWLVKHSEGWRGVGAKLHQGGRTVPVGSPGTTPPSKKLDD